MKCSFVVVLFSLLTLTSCQRDDTFVPAAELPFATHPSVLRGNWSGTIFNVPESKNSTLELTNLTAECADYPESDTSEDTCCRYAFSGNISVEGSASVPLTGEGYSSDYLYTLTEPREPTTPSVYATFELGGENWSLVADYRSSDSQNLESEPSFEGLLSTGNPNRGSSFLLEPTP